MAFDDVVHKIDEFANFPWGRMEEFLGHFSGKLEPGGSRVDFMPYIRLLEEDGSMHDWAIPIELAELVNKAYERGQESVKSDLRMLIGVRPGK